MAYMYCEIVPSGNELRTAVEFALSLVILSRRKGESRLAVPCFELTWSHVNTQLSASPEEKVCSCIPVLLGKLVWRSYS